MSIVSISMTGESSRTIQRMRLRGDKLKRELPGMVGRAATYLASAVAENELGKGKSLEVVTGMLRRSVAGRVVGKGAAVAAMIGITKGPAAKYAAIHERGGVIRAKGKGALAIPLKGARTAGGKPRFPGGPREAAEKYPDMYMLKRPGKPPLLVRPLRVRGGGGKGRAYDFEPLFVLKKSVKVRAKHWLSGGVQRNFDVFHVSLEGDINELLGAGAA